MKKKYSIGVPIIFLSITIVTIVILNLFFSQHIIDSDMSSELILARVLKREHAWLSLDWFYSTEIRIISFAQIASLFFHFTTDYSLVRTLTNLVFYVGLFTSFWYFMRSFLFSKTEILWGSVFLFLPVSLDWMEIMVIGSFYSIYMITMFLVLGSMERIRNSEIFMKNGKQRRFYLFHFTVIGIMMFLFGLVGIRGAITLLIPLIVAFTYQYRTLLLTEKKNRGIRCGILISFFGFLAGYLYNKLVLATTYHFLSFDNAKKTINFTLQSVIGQLSQFVHSILKLFGFREDIQINTFTGLISLGSAVVAAIVIFVFIDIKKSKKLSDHEPCLFLWHMIVITFGIYIIIFSLTDFLMDARYMFQMYILMIPLFLLYCRGNRKNTILVLGVSAFLAVSAITLCSVSMTQNVNEEISEVADFLRENDYAFGYATFWNANIVTELTDGRVQVSSIILMNQENEKWLKPEKYRNPRYKSNKKRFVIFTKDEITQNDFLVGGLAFLPLIYETNTYAVYELPKGAVLFPAWENLSETGEPITSSGAEMPVS